MRVGSAKAGYCKLLRKFISQPVGLRISTIIALFFSILFIRLLGALWIMEPFYTQEDIIAISKGIPVPLFDLWFFLTQLWHEGLDIYYMGFVTEDGHRLGAMILLILSGAAVFILLKRFTDRDYVAHRLLDSFLFVSSMVVLIALTCAIGLAGLSRPYTTKDLEVAHRHVKLTKPDNELAAYLRYRYLRRCRQPIPKELEKYRGYLMY